MPLAQLENRSLIRLEGPETAVFLNGLVSSALPVEGEGAYGALLTPQGKIFADFMIGREAPNAFLLDCPQTRRDALITRLTQYRLRAKVTITPLPEWEIFAFFDALPPPLSQGLSFIDPRLPALGGRLYAPRQSLRPDASADAYLRHRLDADLPEGDEDFAFEATFPHEALMDALGGVDFKKGCYVGQEIVARMEYRGRVPKRILGATYAKNAPEKGTAIIAKDRVIGAAGSGSGAKGLVLLRLDLCLAALAQKTPLTANEETLVVHKPAYARFSFETSQ